MKAKKEAEKRLQSLPREGDLKDTYDQKMYELQLLQEQSRQMGAGMKPLKADT